MNFLLRSTTTILLALVFVSVLGQVSEAQLIDTMGAMSIGSDMAAGSAQSATEQAPRQGGRVGALGQANADRNAQIEGEANPDGGGDGGQGGGGEAPPPPQNVPKAGASEILKKGWWGPGGYISPIKLALYFLVFLLWTLCANWMNTDMERLDNPNREAQNLIYLGVYAGVGTVVFFVPLFWAAFPITVLLCLVPLLVYVVKRNSNLPPHEKVFTGEHLWYLFAMGMNRIGVKIKVTPRLSYEGGPPIELEAFAIKGDPAALKGRLILARNAPGYNTFREQVYDAITCRAAALMFDFSPERTVIRHQVDGTWFDLEPVPRLAEKGKTKDRMEDMLEAAKLLIGGNPNDRRSQQTGMFVANIGTGKKKTKYEADFRSQGTKTGEAAIIQITARRVPFKSVEALGMRPELQAKLAEQINSKQGVFIVCAPPANGLRSSMDVFLRNSDRFTRDVVNIEDVMAPTEKIENVLLSNYDSSKGETPLKVLPDVVFKEPHVLILRDMCNLETFEFCCKEVDKHRLILTTVRAKDGIEAINKFLAMKIAPELFLTRLNGVICQRLIRTLCSDCKEPYQPAPQLLQQLGLRPDQAKEFYRVRTPLPLEHEERKRGICPTCNGIGYFGRTAMFEITLMSDSVRALIMARANPNEIHQQLQKEGQTGFMYEGVLLLLKGETTVEELSRVMKM